DAVRSRPVARAGSGAPCLDRPGSGGNPGWRAGDRPLPGKAECPPRWEVPAPAAPFRSARFASLPALANGEARVGTSSYLSRPNGRAHESMKHYPYAFHIALDGNGINGLE